MGGRIGVMGTAESDEGMPELRDESESEDEDANADGGSWSNTTRPRGWRVGAARMKGTVLLKPGDNSSLQGLRSLSWMSS